MTQFNPMQFLSMVSGGANPQQLMLQMLSQAAKDNPVMANLLQMAQNGQTQEIEQFARNFCASRGADFDKEFSAFKQQIGGGK